eukprot:Sspe_Gene.94164::Locus_66608_Transcript_1_1_Confidence_1.000_Length_1727::g.94164::m.94164
MGNCSTSEKPLGSRCPPVMKKQAALVPPSSPLSRPASTARETTPLSKPKETSALTVYTGMSSHVDSYSSAGLTTVNSSTSVVDPVLGGAFSFRRNSGVLNEGKQLISGPDTPATFVTEEEFPVGGVSYLRVKADHLPETFRISFGLIPACTKSSLLDHHELPSSSLNGVGVTFTDTCASYFEMGRVIGRIKTDAKGQLSDTTIATDNVIGVWVGNNEVVFSVNGNQLFQAKLPFQGAVHFAVSLSTASILSIHDTLTSVSDVPRLPQGSLILDPTPLGEGAHGVTYAASIGDTRVAVKKLKTSTERAKRSFTREVTAMLAVKHPNVVSLVGVSQEDLTIVTELCGNGDLGKYCKANPTMKMSKRLHLAKQIARGLKAVVDVGYGHCDVNPQNVFVTEGGNAKVGDFGLAMKLSQLKGKRMGSLLYMAPEVIEGVGCSEASDVFSYALLLRALFKGGAPLEDDYWPLHWPRNDPRIKPYIPVFTSKSRAMVAAGIVQGNRPSLSPCIPLPIQDLIRKCWNPTPGLRPTFAEILESLEAIKL